MKKIEKKVPSIEKLSEGRGKKAQRRVTMYKQSEFYLCFKVSIAFSLYLQTNINNLENICFHQSLREGVKRRHLTCYTKYRKIINKMKFKEGKTTNKIK